MTATDQDRAGRIERAARGDEDAFRELVREVYPTLRRWALARAGDPDDADELVQRTLIGMHRGLGRFSARSRLSSWLYRIMQNAAIDLERARDARPDTDPAPSPAELDDAPAAGSDPLRALHAGRLAEAVRDFLEGLPTRQREVLELVDQEGRQAVDVAEMLGIAPGSVRASLFKARRAVRRAILARYPELMEGYHHEL